MSTEEDSKTASRQFMQFIRNALMFAKQSVVGVLIEKLGRGDMAMPVDATYPHRGKY